MKKILCFFSLILLFACAKAPEISSPLPRTVIVSVLPYKYFIERIAEDTVQVQTLVPIGANPHLFEPTPKQIEILSHADLWFSLGEPFEAKIQKIVKESPSGLSVVDVKKNVPLLGHAQCTHEHHNHAEAKDLHIWLSPKLAKTQAKWIAENLIATYPENTSLYEKNLNSLLQDLDRTDAEIAALLAPMEGKAILVSHPAFEYFCKEYHLIQLSIEQEGKDPLPKDIEKTLTLMEKYGVKNILVQPQYNNKGAELIAEKRQLPTYLLDPYSADYIENLLHLARTIAKNA